MNVGYYYLHGTNIEVAVRAISKSGRLARISYRVGKNRNMKNLSKAEKLAIARVQKEKTIPCDWLSKKPAFTKRGVLKKKFKPVGTAAVLDINRDLFVWGIIKGPVKKIDNLTGVVTFATTPVRRAHLSVLRNAELPTFQFDEQVTCIVGTNARVKLLLEQPSVSLYALGNTAYWIPNELIFNNPIQTHNFERAELIGTVHLHGLIPLLAYATDKGTLLRLPGQLSKPNTWANADAIHLCVTRPNLIDFKKDLKKAYLIDRRHRHATLQSVV
jgi:hypothetical protein